MPEPTGPRIAPGDPVDAAASSAPVRRLAARLATGAPAAAGGAWGSSSALVLAALARSASPLLVVVGAAPEAEGYADDLAAFLGRPPLVLPESGTSPVAASERLRIARLLASGGAPVVVAPVAALSGDLPSPADLDASRIRLTPGDRLDLDALADRLVGQRFERTHAVEVPGEFAVRGGILDVYPPGLDHPVRVELLGTRIESVRSFGVGDQHSIADLPFAEFSLATASGAAGLATIADHLPKGGWIAVREPGDLKGVELASVLAGRPVLTIQALPVPEVGAAVNFRTVSLQRFSGQLANVARELAEVSRGSERVIIYSANEGEQDRLAQLLGDAGVDPASVELRLGRLTSGFLLADAGLAVLSNHELFNRYRLRRPTGRGPDARPIDSLLELRKGDIVVHISHGLGRFLGIEKLDRHGRKEDFVVLEYQDHARVYVPVANIDLIQKYVGGSEHAPPLHKIGGTAWGAQKLRAEESVLKLAQELLQVQALRGLELGIAYPPDTEWQRAFEAAFPYEDTEDQAEVSRAIKRDLEAPRPMDRLVCGDVGFGKTELAMRAAFKAATANKQVAVLVPTTVLAQQHYQTFRERMADYPVTVEVISRFRSKREQKRILLAAAEGKIDILLGTHRIVQDDVRFKDLGLVVIDEEQRFGVEHKERLKRLRATVDVLTLTATPIPRTLHMSLLGIRDISTLSTPPRDRLAIRTEVLPTDDRRIREAILEEKARGGQVYFIHNRVYSIEGVRKHLQRIVPEATFGVVHGQMDEDEVEPAMIDFLERRTDVLIATTIIESGIDIPNVNTILIDNADQFGLADLHQLRGRVGRYKVQARCLLLLPRDRSILPQARRRLKAIEEFSELGSGYRIAMRDLEIRGVGNLLGREQHGHIAAVGYDLYLKMLEKAAKRLKREQVEDLPETGVDLAIEAGIPEEYVPDLRSRVEAYRRVVASEDLAAAREDLEDRYGPVPAPVDAFLKVVAVKRLASRWRISALALGKECVVASYLNPPLARELSRRNPKEVRVVDERTIHIYPAGSPSGVAMADALLRLLAAPR